VRLRALGLAAHEQWHSDDRMERGMDMWLWQEAVPLMRRHPTVAFYATGDPCQLRAIGDPTAPATKLAWLERLFGTVVAIAEPVRCLEPALLLKIEHMLFGAQGCSYDGKIPPEVIAMFRQVTLEVALAELGVKRGITYTNSTADFLNEAFAAHHPVTELRCRQTFSHQKTQVPCGATLRILSKAPDGSTTSLELKSGGHLAMEAEAVTKHFKLPFVSTTHRE
jgi:hypothetical protein